MTNDLTPNGRAPLAAAEHHARQTKLADFEREALPNLDFLYRFGLHLSGDPTAAEDLAQETMLKAWRAWHTYRVGSNVRAWLATILRNIYINEHRRRRLVMEVDLPESDCSALMSDPDSRDPEGEFFASLIDDQVVRAIGRLPQPFRETLVLSDVEDLSYKGIAGITGVPVGTVKSRLFRARRVLQRQLRTYAVEMQYIAPAAVASA